VRQSSLHPLAAAAIHASGVRASFTLGIKLPPLREEFFYFRHPGEGRDPGKFQENALRIVVWVPTYVGMT
jgi:hypothetical protein